MIIQRKIDSKNLTFTINDYIALCFSHGVISSKIFYTLTSCNNGSKEYNAGLLPDASSIVVISFFSKRILVNLAALGAGIPLFLTKLLFLNTGYVKIKSNALTLHLEAKVAENFIFISSYNL